MILTDHTNLTYWKSPQNLNRCTTCWHADLQEYDFEIKHIPGNTNIPADALSQPPGVDQGENDNQRIIMIPLSRVHTTITIDKPTNEFLRSIMTYTHDHVTVGHPGQDETIRKTKEIYQWPGMNDWIAGYVKGCTACQQNKIIMQQKRIPLYGITVPHDACPFQQIAMDLIMGLPLRKGKDAILTIVDHGCSRATVFLSCSTNIMGPGIAQLYLEHVYRWFGLPKKMISNCDPRFTSHFGKALLSKLGITQNLSMAFHPQTDGLSEWKNQWIEQYLRLVMSSSPEHWTQWLDIALAVHNNWKNTTTGLSPNQILIGYETTLAPPEMPPSNNEMAENRIKSMMEHWAQAIDAINKAAKGNRSIPEQYAIGDQVWLEGKHLRFPHQKNKLNPKRYGPFKIIKVISSVAYQLQLPPSWKIHPVFHASLLSPYCETPSHGPNFS